MAEITMQSGKAKAIPADVCTVRALLLIAILCSIEKGKWPYCQLDLSTLTVI